MKKIISVLLAAFLIVSIIPVGAFAANVCEDSHTAATPVVENHVKSTCISTGYYDSVTYCKLCGEEISRLTIALPEVEHIFNPFFTETANFIYGGSKCSVCSYQEISSSSFTKVFEYVFGDVNDDQITNNKDLALLMMHLNLWDVLISTNVADIDGDGDIDNRDYAFLMMYVNGYFDTSNSPGSGTSTPSTPSTPSVVTDVDKILQDAFALAEGTSLPYTSVLTGKVIAVDEEYDPEYNNVTVTISVSGYEDTPIKCYRLIGTNVEMIEKNDTITVSGIIKNNNGNIEFEHGCTMTKRISGGGVVTQTDPAKIMAAAYALRPGENLGYEVTLEGKVTSIKTAYDPSFDNISVVISVAGKDLLCYRMVGEDVSKVVGGDTITVTGMIKNYNGTIEFDAGCTMRKRVSGEQEVITDSKQIVDEAFKLQPGQSLPYSVSLTGKITAITTEYSDQYKNITVIIEVEGSDGMKELKCYRMKGEGAQDLKVGDVITVTGIIKNYQHTSGDCEVEFDAGCTFVKE